MFLGQSKQPQILFIIQHIFIVSLMDKDFNWGKLILDYSLEGRPSNVPFHALRFYVELITKSRAKLPNPNWLPSVREFQTLVNSDPVLRMNWQNGIKLSTHTISTKTSEQIFEMIDTVCKTPPAFTHHILVGVPINAIFIEFMQNENGRTFFSHQRVNQALKKVMNDYSLMLQSSHSTKYLTTETKVGWFSPEADAEIHNQWYKCDTNDIHYGFKCWNDWFLREFKDGMRPIGQGTPEGLDEQNVIVNSCESTPLTIPPQPIVHVKFQDEFWLKDNRYSLTDMFGGLKYNKEYLAQQFEKGTVYQAFLSALSYHRWHAPVDGVIEEIYSIDGTYYLDQSQFIGYDEGSPQKCESFLSAVAARMVIVIKANNPKIGKIGIIYIGMAEVSSCVATVKEGEKVKKGQQIGHFMFGGSSHLMVFEKKAADVLKFKENVYKYNNEKEVLQSERQNVKSYLCHIAV